MLGYFNVGKRANISKSIPLWVARHPEVAKKMNEMTANLSHVASVCDEVVRIKQLMQLASQYVIRLANDIFGSDTVQQQLYWSLKAWRAHRGGNERLYGRCCEVCSALGKYSNDDHTSCVGLRSI